MTKPSLNLSLDIESVGLRPGSGVWQIGCIAIENPELKFYGTLHPTAASSPPFTFDEITIQWQREKNTANWQAAYDLNNYVYARHLLLDFAEGYRNLAANYDIYLWTKGPHFDIALLDEAYRRLGLNAPWKYHSIRDMRTLQHLFPNVQVPKPDGLHDALVDAKYQGEVIKACFEEMINLGMMTNEQERKA